MGFFFHLEQITGKPIGPAKGTESANRLQRHNAPHFSVQAKTSFIIQIKISGYLSTPQEKTGEVQFEHVPCAKFELFCLKDISYVAKGPVKPPKLANNAKSPHFAQMVLTPIIIQIQKLRIKVSVSLDANLSAISEVWPTNPLNPYATAISHPKPERF